MMPEARGPSRPHSALQAIETSYAGCRFRSRLEARWAVFFDHLRLDWEYESQGWKSFEGGNDGVKYLPDFHLPRLNLWLEVKPANADVHDPDGVRRWEWFAGIVAFEWTEGRTAMLCGSIPNPDLLDRHGPPRGYSRFEQPVVTLGEWHSAWCACPTGRHFDIQFQARGGRILCGCTRVQDDRLYYTGNHPKVVAAYDAARAKRFEHGERAA